MRIQFALVLTGIIGAAAGLAVSSRTASAASEGVYIAPHGGQSFSNADCVRRDWWHLYIPSSCALQYVDWPLSVPSAHNYVQVNVKFRQKDQDFSCSLYSVPADGNHGYVTTGTQKKTGTSRTGSLYIPEVATPGAYAASVICTMLPDHRVYSLFQFSHNDY